MKNGIEKGKGLDLRAEHQSMWPRLKSRRRRYMWVEFVVDSLISLRGFSLITPVFPSPQKPTFPNSNSTRNQAR